VLDKPMWVDVTGGKTRVVVLDPDPSQFGRMVLCKTNIRSLTLSLLW
jgi:hypothetical protein